MTAVLGIDLGTSQVKVLCRALDGTVLGQGTASYPVTAPAPGWAESDPELWWRAVRAGIQAAAPAEVAAIGLAGQMHGVVLSSQRAEPLRPAILWLDRRARTQAGSYAHLTSGQLVRLANAPWSGAAGPILAWLAAHEPDVYQAARWQLQPKDWLRFRLTGVAGTDPSDASGTLAYDVAGDHWARDVIDALGLRDSLFAPVAASDSVAGSLLPGAAAELGLPGGIPVVTGCSDTAASLFAAGLPGPQWALLTLGTGGQWMMPVPPGADPAPDPSGSTSLLRGVDGWFRLAGAQNVGITLDWVRRTLGCSWDELYASAAAPPVVDLPVMDGPQADGPVFAPWLVSERGNDAGGGWSGVRLADQPRDLMRAALTGVAGLLGDWLADLRAAAALPADQPARVLLGGGGGQHPAWRELLAEVLGVPLRPAPTPWLTAHGAATLAARAFRG